ncbi:uncharacterized protein LOC112464608 [Temnothorax curvispinosus]|uniref:Uncharacterized protein LOC112464608 n=1 Tax=Temnothorax curvispinosus TaxID=300111 RepID=A0A6J1R035_9HYME|nr:uncharacterized protein LOC112464608 [Temnothorax curvispinosus]
MENTIPEKKVHFANAIESNDQYAASYLKTGSTRGVMYQMKLLTWITWKLMCKNNASIGNWWLATEVCDARGFHDLVLKYSPDGTSNGDGGTSDGKYMYRFMQIKHKRSLEKNANITSYHLTSKHKLHRQGSLIYLFKAYVNMLGNFEKITPDQIVDLTIFTNMDINAFKFLVPVEGDKLYGFEGKGKRYRIDIKVLKKEPGIMICLYHIMPDDNIIFGFLRKLVFAVCQPSEPELEELIVKEMGKTFNVPQIFYDNLYKNIINWFLVYDNGKAPYLTENHVMKYLKDTQDMLWEAKKTEMLVDPVSKIADKLKVLSL